MCKNENYVRPEFDEERVKNLKDNAMLKVKPELYNEWYFEKNEELGYDIYKMTKGSHKKPWWICPKCDSFYDSRIAERIKGNNCPYCTGHRINHTNSLASLRPDLAKEWDYEKNDKTPEEVTCGNNKKFWWICNSCGESIYISIYERVNFNRGCKSCQRKELLKSESLAVKHPQLVPEWHPTKNGDLTPYDVTCGEDRKVWWLCKEGHEWEADINNRVNGRGCHYCSGRYVWRGFNDLWTTHPEIAKLLLNKEDGYKYSKGSAEKLNWKCLDCGDIVKNKQISTVVKYSFKCPNCSDGTKYPEKVMYNVLKELNIEFMHDVTIEWSINKRYDFYIPSLNIIIETHGAQHYDSGFETVGGRSLKEEQENDKYKYELAIKNGINKYIVIDCRKSEIEWIKEKIMSSELSKICDLSTVDWIEIDKRASKSLVFECSKLWNFGYSVKDISKYLNIHRGTVSRYLIKGKDLNLNSYIYDVEKEIVQLDMNTLELIKKHKSVAQASKELGRNASGIVNALSKNGIAYNFRWLYLEDYKKFIEGELSLTIKGLKSTRRIVQLTLEGEYISHWISISEASRKLGFKSISGIRGCCSGELYSSGGFKWMYEEDYNDFVAKNKEIEIPPHLKYKKGIVQLDLNGNFVKSWKSFNDICDYLNKDSANIVACCKGRNNSAYGYKWMYKIDYDEIKK